MSMQERNEIEAGSEANSLAPLDAERFDQDQSRLEQDTANGAADGEGSHSLGPSATGENAATKESELVASEWRVLPDAHAFPNEEAFRAAAQSSGQAVTSSVRSEDGGFRHELVLEPNLDGGTKDELVTD